MKLITFLRPFQVIGFDVTNMPCTSQGNKHVVLFQDMFNKWPMVFAVPDQITGRIVKLLCEEIVQLFGVPESLLTDKGANFLSHLVLDVCSLLGIQKLNITAYLPECNSMVEWFNCKLKSMLLKRVAQFGAQWEKNLSAVL